MYDDSFQFFEFSIVRKDTKRTRKKPCERCGGDGEIKLLSSLVNCKKCGGTGNIDQ